MTAYSGYRHFAGLKGTKVHVVGKDPSAYLYTDLQSAIDAAQHNDLILIHPGTYTATSQITITKPLRFVGLGGSESNGVKITCSGIADAMIDVELAAQSAAAELYFQDIKFIQGVDNQNVFDVNNTNVGQALYMTFQNCDVLVYDSASTGKAVDISHASATEAIVLTMGSCRNCVTGCINATFKNASDLIVLVGMDVNSDGNASGVITSADDIAAGVEFHGCVLEATAGLTGGHATQTVKSYFSHDGAGVAATADFAGSHSETIVGS